MKKIVSDFLIQLCGSYTIISVGGSIINMICKTETNNRNVFMMFSFCIIACLVLNLYKLFDRFSPLFMIVIQYIIAVFLVFLTVTGFGKMFHETITARNWYEIFRSFTIPYVIGAAVFYYGVYIETKAQNRLIKELQKAEDTINNE